MKNSQALARLWLKIGIKSQKLCSQAALEVTVTYFINTVVLWSEKNIGETIIKFIRTYLLTYLLEKVSS